MRERQGASGLLDTARELADNALNSEPKEKPRDKVAEERDESVWDRMEHAADIAPVQGDPSLEPANNPWEVAMMAGWGDVDGRGRGHDAIYGVDRMVTGETDATGELDVDSGTAGTPLQLGPREDLDRCIDPVKELSCPESEDWTSHL